MGVVTHDARRSSADWTASERDTAPLNASAKTMLDMGFLRSSRPVTGKGGMDEWLETGGGRQAGGWPTSTQGTGRIGGCPPVVQARAGGRWGGCCVCGAESAAQPYHEIVASGLPHGNGGGAVVCRRAPVGKMLAEEPLLRRNGRGSSG
eukprot:4876565-Prymnesium_polylepis.1